MDIASLMDIACLIIRASLVTGRIKKNSPLGDCLMDIASLMDIACLIIRACLVTGRIKQTLLWVLA